MAMRTRWPAISASELVDLEARTRAAIVTISNLPPGEVRSRALAEATDLQARAQVLCRIAIEDRDDMTARARSINRSS
jgi:hypothetical protein